MLDLHASCAGNPHLPYAELYPYIDSVWFGEIYGAEHLTRLLTKLPEIVNAHAVEAYTEAYHSGGEPPPPTDWKELVRTPPLNPF